MGAQENFNRVAEERRRREQAEAAFAGRDLFTIPPRDPSVTAVAAPRLSTQSQAILARLREGTATNRDLAAIALKYTSRISDLRGAGAVITVADHDHASGRVTYRLDRDVTG